jgi:glycosyltransferase involved in cell wall biosynthesis
VFPHRTRAGWFQRLESLRRPSSYLFSTELRQNLERVLQDRVDVLHLEELSTGWLGLQHRTRAVLSILNLYGIDLQSLRSFPQWRYRMMAQAERRLIRQYPTITTLTARLAGQVRQITPDAHIATTPLGLALDQYPFRPAPDTSTPTVGLIGNFSWAPTVSAATRLLDRLWPAIRRLVPGARLQLVGRQVRTSLGARDFGPGVSIHENAEDIAPYFRNLDVLLYAPLHATGMKIKVLEAMAFGVAVVTNEEGMEGIPAEDGIHVGLAEDDAGLVGRTVALLESHTRRTQQASRARALIETHCSSDVALDRTEALYRDMLDRRSDEAA